MKLVVAPGSTMLRMLVWLGLFGLVASFHGIILGYSRQIFALARAGFLPSALGAIHPRFGTPWIAVLAGGAVGLAAIFSDTVVRFGGQSLTANIVTMSAIGAVFMYVISLLALFRLRRREPEMPRPFRALGYPIVPAWGLVSAVTCLLSLMYFNRLVTILFVALLAAGYLLLRGTGSLARAQDNHVANR